MYRSRWEKCPFLTKNYILWDIPPCIPLKVNRRFKGTCRLHLQDWRIRQARNQNETAAGTPLLTSCFMLVSCLSFSSILKMEATCSSETSVDFQRNTRRCISENRTLHNYCRENLRFYVLSLCIIITFLVRFRVIYVVCWFIFSGTNSNLWTARVCLCYSILSGSKQFGCSKTPFTLTHTALRAETMHVQELNYGLGWFCL
jgi:hypothetical protein